MSLSLVGYAADSEDFDPDTIEQKPIVKSNTVEGDEKAWAVESTYRSQFIYPSNWGHAGIFRVRSAESLPPQTLSFGIGGEFYSVSNAPSFPGLATGSQDARTIAESLFVGYAPFEHFTIGVMRKNSSTTFGNPDLLISSLGDMNLSLMYSFPINESMAIAPIGNVLVASNFNSLSPSGNTVSAGLGAAFSFSLFPSTGIPLFLHSNVIYHMPQVRTATTNTLQPEVYFPFSRFHTVSLGLGAEYRLGDFIPFFEFYDTVQTDSTLSFGSSPSKISVGTRITPLENKSLAFLLGADIGLGKGLTQGVPYNPDYQILGQISYTVGLTNSERKHYHTTKDVNVVNRKFIIGKSITFLVGKAELDGSSTHLLDQIGEVIVENKVKKLLIVGHTDSSAPEDFNLKLSLARGNTVKNYLIKNSGVAEDALVVQGYGKQKPRASNDTESGRAENRRVEFFILE